MVRQAYSFSPAAAGVAGGDFAWWRQEPAQKPAHADVAYFSPNVLPEQQRTSGSNAFQVPD